MPSRGLTATTCCRRAFPRGSRSNWAWQGWQRYIGDRGDILSIERFGASAPADILLREYGFNVDQVVARARSLLASIAGPR
jgi:transketolase